ncbi:nucleotidyltransferase family protein [Leptolyngbya sp. CCY15150]|uniref:nucleotidyltransferase family protein n=1 Tax=Leptolyngbya sp. CCY15150 TaxID=2767772 RepID=UPI00195157E4|nr:nucleotidyltransferase family protein [Leptolyngbya sp. CCY15150]
MTYAAILLAAGASRRMGRCKTTLPWGDRPSLLTYQTEQIRQAGLTSIVVLSPHNAHRQVDCAPNTQVVINPNPEQGKVSSILTGLAYLPTPVTALFLCAIDQPRPADLYLALINANKRHAAPITAPVHQGKLGHPLLFSATLLPRLQQIRDETLGLRAVVQQVYPQIHRLEWPSALVHHDLNTPDAYTQAYAVSPSTCRSDR